MALSSTTISLILFILICYVAYRFLRNINVGGSYG